MKLRPKTARRLLLLVVLLAMVGTGAVGLVFVRKWQNNRRTEALRTDGMAFVEKGQFPEAIDNLGRYLRRHEQDQDAWLAYARAREVVEEANGSHLVQTASALQKALSLGEVDRATSIKLARLYNTIGYHNEARDLAAKLRPANLADAKPEHADALVEEVTARASLKAFDDELDRLTETLLVLVPNGHRALTLRIGFLNESGRRAEASKLVADRSAAAPDDLRLQLLSSIVPAAGATQPDPELVKPALCKAAGLEEVRPVRAAPVTYTEPEFVEQLVSLFDAFRMYAHSVEVLRDAEERLPGDDFRRLFVRRAWATGNYGAVTRMKERDKEQSPEHSEILAFRALAARDAGRTDQAAEILATLDSRKRDFVAKAWTAALRPLIEKAEPLAGLKALDAALAQHPNEPVFAYFRGEFLVRLRRADEARAAWAGIGRSQLMGGWSLPAVRRAETLMDEGRLEEALTAANEARQLNPNSLSGEYTVLRAECAMIENGKQVAEPEVVLGVLDKAIARLLEIPDKRQAGLMTEVLLPGRMALLVAAGKPDEARRAARDAIGGPAVPSPDTLRRMALVSVRHQLGIESECIAAAKSSPQDSTGTVLTEAMLLYQAGKRTEAIALIARHGADAPAAEKEEWELARVKFLDAMGDDGALEAWRAIAAASPGSLPVQSAVLLATAPAADPALVESAIARVTELGGSDRDRPSVAVRYARARAVLFKPANAKARDEGISLLRSLVVDAPGLMGVRQLLVQAMLMDEPAKGIRPDRAGAIEQLRSAAAVTPDRAPFVLRLAQLLAEEGRPADAAAELARLGVDPDATPAARLEAIDMLIRQRDIERARVVIEEGMRKAGVDVPVDLQLRYAEVLAALRRDREALEVYRGLAARELQDSGAVTLVALNLRSMGEAAAADKLIADLDARRPRTLPILFNLARYAERADDNTAAERYYREAIELDPADARAWLNLARFQISTSAFDAAAQTAKSGLEKIPEDAQLMIVLQQAQMAGAGEENVDLLALSEALRRNPATVRRADSLLAIKKATDAGKMNDPATLTAIAEEFSDEPVSQAFLVRRLVSLSPPALAPAATLIDAANRRFPSDANLAELAVSIHSARGDWTSMLRAAQAWQQLTRTVRSDVAVAEAQLGLGLPRQAVDQVRAFALPAVVSDTDAGALGVLNVRARGGAMLGEVAAATRLVEPRLASSSLIRVRIALPLVDVLPTAADAEAWIRRCATACDPTNVEEQVAVARAWANAAERFKPRAKEFLDNAIAATSRLPGDAVTAARVLEFRATLQQAAGDTPGAIASCRESLKAVPDAPSVSLLLARLLLAADEDPAEAVQIAQRTSALIPDSPAPRLVLIDALIRKARRADASREVAAAAQARAEAQAALAAAADDPKISDWNALGELAGLAEVMGDRRRAIAFYERALAASPAPEGRGLAVMRNNIAFAMFLESPTAADSLRKAREHALGAIALVPLPDFYETLGSIESALSNRSGAIAAYRQAISIAPNSLAARAGLADLLSVGSAAEREEAAGLVKSLDEAIASGAKLSDRRAEQLMGAKTRLASR